MKNKIIIEGDVELKDNELREEFRSLYKKVENLNNRTKLHTLDIRENRKRIKKMEEEKKRCAKKT